MKLVTLIVFVRVGLLWPRVVISDVTLLGTKKKVQHLEYCLEIEKASVCCKALRREGNVAD